ncbi:hypothetical protein O3P69_020279 [Scylla paramamosain]|uniref:Uncharacterized protein n=1 Tax=Scylla paramamosain TaxID=85552 RepID=A0AAW0TNN9_SCYPA
MFGAATHNELIACAATHGELMAWEAAHGELMGLAATRSELMGRMASATVMHIVLVPQKTMGGVVANHCDNAPLGAFGCELLSQEELGGEKPTDLLRRMKKLLGDKYTSFDKELFLQLFYQRLPPDTQRCLFTVKNKLSVDKLATLADEFMATLPQDADFEAGVGDAMILNFE